MKKRKVTILPNKQRLIKYAVFSIIFLLILTLLVLSLIEKPNKNEYTLERYLTAKEAQDYDRIANLYSDAQQVLADLPEDGGDAAQVSYLLNRIESDLQQTSLDSIREVLNGGSLTEDGWAELELAVSIAGDSILNEFDKILYDYLTGLIDENNYIHYLETFYPKAEFSRFFSEQFENYADIYELKKELAPVLQMIDSQEYMAATEAINSFINSEYSQYKSLNKVLKQMLAETKSELYINSKTDIDDLIGRERYYDAALLIDSIIDYFPEEEELKQLKDFVSNFVPDKVADWAGSVEAIAVKPLIADTERAFDGDIFSDRANDDLLSTDEFRLLLEALYDEDYVLINAADLADESGNIQTIRLPADKKPLVLFLDEFYFNPQREESGICSRIDLNDNLKIVGIRRSKSGEEDTLVSGTAINILDEFLLEYPGFSFNGAKGVITLSAIDGVFGYPLNTDQANRMSMQYAELGLADMSDDMKDLTVNKLKVKSICDKLSYKGWLFASQSYARLSVPDTSLSELKNDIEKMDSLLEDIIDLKIFSFTGGNHAEAEPDKASYLAGTGFIIQSGSGSTHAYTVQKSSYIYLDKTIILAKKLRDPLLNGLDRFVGSRQIIEEDLRP